MKRKSLKDRLAHLVAEQGYLSYGAMCQFVAEEGYKVSTAERRLRELMAESVPLIKSEIKTSRRHTPYIAGYLRIGVEPPKKHIEVVVENGVKIARLVV